MLSCPRVPAGADNGSSPTTPSEAGIDARPDEGDVTRKGDIPVAIASDDSPVPRDRLVYRWDLDKTYLRTEFDTVRDLLRTAFETAKDKRAVPGAPALLREIRASEPHGIYIVSGSPEQLRRVLEAKLRLDGIRWDGFVLKPQLRNILRGRFRFLKDQVSYKLAALLDTRARLPLDVREYMFGDDAEADAFIYSLYSDLCLGKVEVATLMRVLELAGVYPDVLPRVVRMAEHLPRSHGALRIFIHLERVSAPGAFDGFGARVCPFYNYLQPALVLHSDGALDPLSVLRVAAELVIENGFTPDALSASYVDLVARRQIGGRSGQALVSFIEDVDESLLATTGPVIKAFGRELAKERALSAPEPPRPSPPDIDYVSMFEADRARAITGKLRALGKLTLVLDEDE